MSGFEGERWGGGKGDDGATEFGEFQTNEDNFLCAKLGRFHH